MGDLVSKEGGEGRGWPLFAASDPPEGSLSSLYLPYPATLRPTLSIATPPLHQTTPLPFRNPRSTSLCALVNLSNYPLPLSYLVCLAASNTNPRPPGSSFPPRNLLSTPMSSSFSFGSMFQGCSLNPLPFHLFFFFSFVLNGFEGWYFLGEGYLFIHILEYLFAYLSILMQLIVLSSRESVSPCNFIYIREKEKIAAS